MQGCRQLVQLVDFRECCAIASQVLRHDEQLNTGVAAPHLTSMCVQLVEPKRLTLAQLKEYDGSDKKKPICLAIRGVIFDVSKGKG